MPTSQVSRSRTQNTHDLGDRRPCMPCSIELLRPLTGRTEGRMDRDLMNDLKEWKSMPHRQPLVLQGARQVGKTWLLYEFGRQSFNNVVYANFDEDPTLRAIFSEGYDLNNILRGLQATTHEEIVPGKTLVIFDEVQQCPNALTSLKYFDENMPELAIAAAGSLLGLTVHEGTGFPVGKVTMRHLYPLTFFEYLDAQGEQSLREILTTGNVPLMRAFASKLKAHLRNYYYVGGMPQAVNTFIQTGNYDAVRRTQNDILEGYRLDLSKHIDGRKLGAALALLEAIPSQLSKENKRLVFGQVREGARGRDFEHALTWLEQAGIVTIVRRITVPRLPLNAYYAAGERRAFKLFLVDIGLLGAMSKLRARTILEGNEIFIEFKGALTEQYACQQLVTGCGLQPFYWSAPKGQAEVDFVVQADDVIYAIETKAEINLRAKSLRTFHNKYPQARAVRLSLADYKQADDLVDVPLYAMQNESLWNAGVAEVGGPG